MTRNAEPAVKIRTNRGHPPADRPALVFVHGAGGTGSHWLGLYKTLAKQFDLVIVDLPGHGDSAGPLLDSVGAYADWLARVVSSEGLEPARTFVVGHSMGGAVAIEYALRHACAGLVLVATGARLRVSPAVLDFFTAEHAGDWTATAAALFYGARATPEMLRLAQVELGKTPRSVYAADFAMCDRWDALDRVASIRLPVLVLSGSADALTPPKYARFLAEKIAGARLVTLEGAGHMLMIEAAGAVSAAVADFVNDVFPVRSADPATAATSNALKEARE